MTPPGEISYDLVMDDEPMIDAGAKWESGVGGVLVRWPRWRPLNKIIVEQLLSSLYGVPYWREVRGPDSMALR